MSTRYVVIPLILFGVGMANALFVIFEALLANVSLSGALLEVFLDPGRHFTHIVLIPLAAWLYWSESNPIELWRRNLWSKLVGIALLLLAASLVWQVFALYKSTGGTALRNASECSNEVVRANLFALRAEFRGEIASKILQKGEGDKSSNRGRTVLREKYAQKQKECGGEGIAWVGLFSTGLALMVLVMWLVWEATVLPFWSTDSRDKASSQKSIRLRRVIASAAVLMLWFPLRAASDWYLELGEFPSRGSAGMIFVALSATALVLGVTFLVNWTASSSMAG